MIQQPNDHVLFLQQILVNAARNRDTARVVILCSPKINCLEIAHAISEITKQNIVTELSLLTFVRNFMFRVNTRLVFRVDVR